MALYVAILACSLFATKLMLWQIIRLDEELEVLDKTVEDRR